MTEQWATCVSQAFSPWRLLSLCVSLSFSYTVDCSSSSLLRWYASEEPETVSGPSGLIVSLMSVALDQGVRWASKRTSQSGGDYAQAPSCDSEHPDPHSQCWLLHGQVCGSKIFHRSGVQFIIKSEMTKSCSWHSCYCVFWPFSFPLINGTPHSLNTTTWFYCSCKRGRIIILCSLSLFV